MSIVRLGWALSSLGRSMPLTGDQLCGSAGSPGWKFTRMTSSCVDDRRSSLSVSDCVDWASSSTPGATAWCCSSWVFSLVSSVSRRILRVSSNRTRLQHDTKETWSFPTPTQSVTAHRENGTDSSGEGVLFHHQHALHSSSSHI